MTQGATIYAFPQVQFVKHIVLTPPINLSYCHPFSSLPTKLVLLSVFASISACAFIYAFMCGVCICYVSVHVGLLVCACVCTYLHACVCVSVSVCMICLCVSVCVINTQQMVQSGHSSSSGAKRSGDAPTGILGWLKMGRERFGKYAHIVGRSIA